MTTFGPHVMFDFHTESKRLADVGYWEDLLISLVNRIEMTPLSDPVVLPSVCENPRWDPPVATGLSGFIVLAESHISFHSFVEAKFVFLDIFSCKDFQSAAVLGFLSRELGLDGTCVVQQSNRGAGFPFS